MFPRAAAAISALLALKYNKILGYQNNIKFQYSRRRLCKYNKYDFLFQFYINLETKRICRLKNNQNNQNSNKIAYHCVLIVNVISHKKRTNSMTNYKQSSIKIFISNVSSEFQYMNTNLRTYKSLNLSLILHIEKCKLCYKVKSKIPI